MSELIGKEFRVLDQGSVTLLDVMGSDADICSAARISYGKGTRSVSDDRTLIRYLMRHGHSSPFEMAEIKIYVRMPMDVMRQFVRHRTASLNEYSTRYSEAIDDMQQTSNSGWRSQDASNKQGSHGVVEEWPEGWRVEGGKVFRPVFNGTEWCCMDITSIGGEVTPGRYLSLVEADHQEKARRVYADRLKFGVAREQARKDLPLSTYTAAIWKCDLHNVLGFLRQRLDPHAQHEIRQYADVIGKIVAELFPLTWEAFRDYRLESVTLSRLEVRAIRSIIGGLSAEDALAAFGNARERQECKDKLIDLEIIGPETKGD